MATTSVSITVQNVNGGTTINSQNAVTVTPTGNNFATFIQSCNTTGAVLNAAGTGLTTYGGTFMLTNNSTTSGEDINVYQDGASCTVLIGVLKVGKPSFSFAPSAALGVKSAAGTPDITVVALEP